MPPVVSPTRTFGCRYHPRARTRCDWPCSCWPDSVRDRRGRQVTIDPPRLDLGTRAMPNSFGGIEGMEPHTATERAR